MLGKCFCILVLVAVVFSFFTGTWQNLANAAVDGAAEAVSLVFSLCGMMCLWCGVINVFKKAGFIEHLSKLLSPLLRIAFPTAFKENIAKEEITSAVCANILGIGNAATPFALSAMKKMSGRVKNGRATDDMVTLAVLGASSVDLLPTTLITLRRAAGSLYPYKIIVPVWISSVCCAVLAVLLCRMVASASKTQTNVL